MDLIRHSINALLYNFPINIMAEQVADCSEGNLMEVFREVLKWEDSAFTKSDMYLLADVVGNNWCTDTAFFISPDTYQLSIRFPLLLNSFSDKVLTAYGSQDPVVRFNDLLRWRCLSLNIGEDMLICAFLAGRDVRNHRDRSTFLWPLVLEHDNIRINSILNEELSDTHAHINASTDVFEFNWLALMNHPGSVSEIFSENRSPESGSGKSIWLKGSSKEYDSIARYSHLNHTLLEWGIVAAAVRVLLYAKVMNRSCDITRTDIIEMFSNAEFNWTPLQSILGDISILATDAMHTSNDLILDYAIEVSEFYQRDCDSPLMVNHGERKFLYKWFYAYFSNKPDIRDNADLMLLYLIIKTKIRREFVQTNHLKGFVNFQDYDHVKRDFWPQKQQKKKRGSGKSLKLGSQDTQKNYESDWNKYRELAYRYAVQTSIGKSGKIHLEMRLTPGDIDSIMKWDYRQSIFGEKDYLPENNSYPITVVIHFIKSPCAKNGDEATVRHVDLRTRLNGEVRAVIEANKKEVPDYAPKIVGVDAAGSELNCRPEVFAPYFRYIRNSDIPNFTYHAGEDFYDVADGLRTIDEAVCFMDYRFGDRIGHGLALGVNVFDFYDERHNNLIIPSEILLDNLVWLKYFAAEHNIQLSPQTSLFIESQFRELSTFLGYRAIDLASYYFSMRLRGDMLEGVHGEDLSIYPPDVRYSPVSEREGVSDAVKAIWNHYELSAECRQKGRRVRIIRLPHSYAKDIAAVQEAMIVDLEKRGITIECNPSSNVKIGRFSRYDNHPIYRLHEVRPSEYCHTMMVTINTDDKGIFNTSLKNEYSLIAIALSKIRTEAGDRRWSDDEIENYLRRIARYGNITRFKHV